jgi:hypothetical protein
MNGKTDAFPPAASLENIESDTGELRWRHADRKAGVVTVSSPRTESLIGFAKPGAQNPLRHLRSGITNEFLSLSLTSLDDKPIAESGRLLLVATTGSAKNTGQKFAEDGKTLENWGCGPVLIDPVAGELTLIGLAKARMVRFAPLTGEGRMAGDFTPAKELSGDWQFNLGTPATTWWIIQVDR